MDSKYLIPLPPKRFQHVNNPAYDPICFRPWFRLLKTRRDKLPLLAEAHRRYKTSLGNQAEIAQSLGVDERELRDYSAFVEGIGSQVNRTQQQVLDEAYDLYCYWKAERSFSMCLKSIAKLYGLKPRPILELWEVDPHFYPTKVKNL